MAYYPRTNLVESRHSKRQQTQSNEAFRLSLQPSTKFQHLRISFDTQNGNRLILRERDLAASLRHSININAHGFIPLYIEKQTQSQNKISNLKNTLGQLQQKLQKTKQCPIKVKKPRKSVLPRQSQCSIDQIQYFKTQYNQKPEYKIHFIKQQYDDTTQYSSAKKSPRSFKQQGPTNRQNKSMSVMGSFRKKNKMFYIQQAIKPIQQRNKLIDEHINMTLKVLQSCSKLRSCAYSQIEEKKINLKKHELDINKKTLLLDLDQTLIHCQEQTLQNKPHDIDIPIKLQNGDYAKAYIYLRPYVISFLKRMAKLYEIIVFTASHSSYADPVLDELDPLNQIFRYRLYRQHCIQIFPNVFAKDLRIINRPIKEIVLVDNAPYSYIFQLQNGIPILPYYHGSDNQLASLQKYLQGLAKCNDVRQMNKQVFKLHRYNQFQNVNAIIEGLYTNF